jgi:helix-turn-helix protein
VRILGLLRFRRGDLEDLIVERSPRTRQIHGQTQMSSSSGLSAEDKHRMLLDVRRAAVFLGESEHALRARVARRTVPFRRLGRRIVFIRAELERFIAELPGVTAETALRVIAERRGGEP